MESEISFMLKNKSLEKTSINMFVSYGGYEIVDGKKKYTPLKYATSLSVNILDWDSKKQRVKQSNPQSSNINQKLNDFETKTYSILSSIDSSKELIDNTILKSRLDMTFGKVEKKERPTSFIEYIKEYKAEKNNWCGTDRNYDALAKNLTDFQTKNNVILTFEKIDINFKAKFECFLRDKNMSASTIVQRFKTIKSIMAWGMEHDYHTNSTYTKKAFNPSRALTDDTKKVYLTNEEIEKIIVLDLSKHPSLDKVRDYFTIGCKTGLRFSDWHKVMLPTNNTEKVIIVRTTKTDTDCVIPISQVLKSILNKYDGKMPNKPSLTSFDEKIKEVCRIAGIDNDVNFETVKGGNKETVTKKKYELVSSHTARRSFATNMYKNNIETSTIMYITGHKSESNLRKYLKMNEQDKKDIVSKLAV
jgi:integrase